MQSSMADLVKQAMKIEERGRNRKGLRLIYLRSSRHDAGFSQEKLAKNMGIDVSTLRRYENAQSGPLSFAFARRIAKSLGVEVMDLTDLPSLEAYAYQGDVKLLSGKNGNQTVETGLSHSETDNALGNGSNVFGQETSNDWRERYEALEGREHLLDDWDKLRRLAVPPSVPDATKAELVAHLKAHLKPFHTKNPRVKGLPVPYLREARENADLLQRHIDDALDARGTVGNYEAGASSPDYFTAQKLARMCGTYVEHLTTREHLQEYLHQFTPEGVEQRFNRRELSRGGTVPATTPKETDGSAGGPPTDRNFLQKRIEELEELAARLLERQDRIEEQRKNSGWTRIFK